MKVNPFFIIRLGEIVKNSMQIYTWQTKNFNKIMKATKQLHDMSFIKELPEFDSSEITLHNEKASAGFIVKRPLDNTILAPFFYHYGIVLGTAKDGTEYLLEMSKDTNGINLTSKIDFLKGYSIETMEIVSKPVKITREEIVEKAKSVQYDVYDLFDFNCIDFAYYIVYDRKLPERSKVFFN